MSDSFLNSELQNVGDEQTLLGFLTKFGESTVNKLKDSLATSGHNGGSASDLGSLEQSIQWKVDPQGNGVWRFSIEMEDYSKFINEGVQGMRNPGKRTVDSKHGGGRKGQAWVNKAPNSPFKYNRNSKLNGAIFRDWARRKGIDPWAVAAAVKRSGIRPNKFIDNVITPKLFKELSEGIEEAGAKQLESFIVAKLLEGLA